MTKNKEHENEKKSSFDYLNNLSEHKKAADADLITLADLKEKTSKSYILLQEKLIKKEEPIPHQTEEQVNITTVENKINDPQPTATQPPKQTPVMQQEWKPRQQTTPNFNRNSSSNFNQNRNWQNGGRINDRPGMGRTGGQGGFNPRPQGQGSYSHPGSTNNSSGYGNRQFTAGGYQQRPFGNNQGQRPFTPRPFNNAAGGYQQRPFGNSQGQRPFGSNAGGFSRAPKLEPITSIIKKDHSAGKNKKDYSRNSSDEARTLNRRQKQKIFDYDSAIDYETEQRMGSRKLRFKKEKEEINIVTLENAVITKSHLTVKEFSEKISKSVSEILKKLIDLGLMLTINSVIDFDTAELIANEFNIKLENKIGKTFEEKIQEVHNKSSQGEEGAEKRAPIVTVMGHVDHGKTSLLDAIRKTSVASSESGGITQHIGAYSITKNKEKITFIDTPGHEAFSAMRARGAKVTDVAILVVAADDGIMPQTIEAIKHIKDAKVPMIVAVNKIDKQDSNIERIKQQLTEHEVVPEEWGGDAIIVPVSAKTGEGLDKLLENVLLVSEIQNLTAVKDKQAIGTVLEAKLDKTRGAVATLLVQDGTLKIGDSVVAGTSFGRIKAMTSDSGVLVKQAGPSEPVSIIGLDDVPKAGDYFYVVDASLSKQVIEERKNKIKQDRIKNTNLSAEDFLAKVDEGKLKTIKLIIKSDVQGSSEALKSSLQALSNSEVKVSCITAVAGQVTESDIMLSSTSGAMIIAFNIKVDSKIETAAKQNKVKINSFKIIYEAVEFIKKEVSKLKEPVYEEEVLGKAEIRNVFKLSSNGSVAGCMVIDGKIRRGAKARLVRGGAVIATDVIDTLKIVKDDQREVSSGFECGIKLAKFSNYAVGDIIECFVLNEISQN